ncbi:hypothetical protein D3C72_1123490 [compost metagenome]
MQPTVHMSSDTLFSIKVTFLSEMWFFTECRIRADDGSGQLIQGFYYTLQASAPDNQLGMLKKDVMRLEDELDGMPELQDHGRDINYTPSSRRAGYTHAIFSFTTTDDPETLKAIRRFRGKKIPRRYYLV